MNIDQKECLPGATTTSSGGDTTLTDCLDPEYAALHPDICGQPPGDCNDPAYAAAHPTECEDGGTEDPNCSDPAYALEHPTECGGVIVRSLVLKPGSVISCTLGDGVKFQAYLSENGQETLLVNDVTFSSSNLSVALIGVNSGNCTGIAAGTAFISASYYDSASKKTLAATSTLTVLSGNDCCADISVAVMLLIDTSKSMGMAMQTSGTITYPKKLDFAKEAAKRVIDALIVGKDSIGVASFSSAHFTIHQAISANPALSLTALDAVVQTTSKTTFYDGLEGAIDALDASGADRKLLVIISDGNDTITTDWASANPLDLTNTFKAAGGIVLSMGCRASGNGFKLLSDMSTGGFMVNAYNGIENAALDFLIGLKGYLCAGNCTPEGDTYKASGKLDYSDFINWDVVGGKVDLQGNDYFDYLPGNGLYVSLKSGTAQHTDPAAILTLKTPVAVTSGHVITIEVRIAGNQVRQTTYASTARVRAYWLDSGGTAQYLVDQLVTIESYKADFKAFTFSFTSPDDHNIYLDIQQESDGGASEDFALIGLLLDSVGISDGTVSLFYDDFDNENILYVAPACGEGATFIPIGGGGYGYAYGYNCYDSDCLDTPPMAQQPDPVYVSDIEGTGGGGGTCTETYKACAKCAAGSSNFQNVVPVMTSNTLPSGVASAYSAASGYEAYKAFASAALHWEPVMATGGAKYLQYKFASAKHIIGFSFNVQFDRGQNITLASAGLLTMFQNNSVSLRIDGSNDGITWTTLHTICGWGVPYSKFTIANAAGIYMMDVHGQYAYYRLSMDWSAGTTYFGVSTFKLYEQNDGEQCYTSTKTAPTCDQAHKLALDDAVAQVQLLLNCQKLWSATATVECECPPGTIGNGASYTATGYSLTSEDDAKKRAQAAAEALCVANMNCTGSTNNAAITVPYLGVPTARYPSTQLISAAGTVTKATVKMSITVGTSGMHHLIAGLRSPTGEFCLLARCAGEWASAPSTLAITFDDDAAGGIGALDTVVTGGSYQPSKNCVDIVFPNLKDVDGVTIATPYSADLSVFSGIDKAGIWSLWVMGAGDLIDGALTINSWEVVLT